MAIITPLLLLSNLAVQPALLLPILLSISQFSFSDRLIDVYTLCCTYNHYFNHFPFHLNVQYAIFLPYFFDHIKHSNFTFYLCVFVDSYSQTQHNYRFDNSFATAYSSFCYTSPHKTETSTPPTPSA